MALTTFQTLSILVFALCAIIPSLYNVEEVPRRFVELWGTLFFCSMGVAATTTLIRMWS